MEKLCAQFKIDNETLNHKHERFMNYPEINSNSIIENSSLGQVGCEKNLASDTNLLWAQLQTNNMQNQANQNHEFHTDEVGYRRKIEKRESEWKNHLIIKTVPNTNSKDKGGPKKYSPSPITVAGVSKYIELYDKLKV